VTAPAVVVGTMRVEDEEGRNSGREGVWKEGAGTGGGRAAGVCGQTPGTGLTGVCWNVEAMLLELELASGRRLNYF
jgi:hypothetical protein